MHLITYVSNSIIQGDQIDSQIQAIVNVAKKENQIRGITGVLFFMNNQFMQIIEGEEIYLRQLMQNITADSRHKDIDILIDTKVERRGFSQLNMDSFHLKNNEVFSSQTMKSLTESFKKNLLPRADSLLFFYRAILEERTS